MSVPLNPVKLGFMQDQTISANWSRTPQLTTDHFEPLRPLFHARGGELACGLIRDRSNRGLVRKCFPAPIAEPKPTPPKDDIFEDAQSEDEYQKKRARWQQDCKRRDEQIDQLFDQFLAEIKPLLAQKPDAGRTDVWGAIVRADLLLNESDAIWPAPTHRYLALVTDGWDNVSRNPVILQSGATVLLVNGSATVGSLAGLNPIRFESVQAAIQHVIAAEEK